MEPWPYWKADEPRIHEAWRGLLATGLPELCDGALACPGADAVQRIVSRRTRIASP